MLPSTIRPAEPGSVLLPLATTEEEEEDSIASIVSVTQGDFRWEEPPGDQSEQQDEPPPHTHRLQPTGGVSCVSHDPCSDCDETACGCETGDEAAVSHVLVGGHFLLWSCDLGREGRGRREAIPGQSGRCRPVGI